MKEHETESREMGMKLSMEEPTRVKKKRKRKKRERVLVVAVESAKNLVWFLGLFLGEKRRDVNGEAETK